MTKALESILTSQVDGRAWRSLALVADSHGVLDVDIAAAIVACEAIIHAGDVGASSVLTILESIAPVYAVRGNNDTRDKWRGDKAILDTLPEALHIRLRSAELIVIHGHQLPRVADRHRKLRAHYANAQFICYGHSHRFVIDRAGTPWIINPGACGRARTFGGASALIMTFRRGAWQLAQVGPGGDV